MPLAGGLFSSFEKRSAGSPLARLNVYALGAAHTFSFSAAELFFFTFFLESNFCKFLQ